MLGNWPLCTMGNEKKLKSWLLPFVFSLVIICLPFVFSPVIICFQECCYILSVWLAILGHSKSHFRDHFLSQLLRKYHWSVWQGMQFQFNTEMTSFRHRFSTIWVGNNHYHSLEKACMPKFIQKYDATNKKGAGVRSDGKMYCHTVWKLC